MFLQNILENGSYLISREMKVGFSIILEESHPGLWGNDDDLQAIVVGQWQV